MGRAVEKIIDFRLRCLSPPSNRLLLLNSAERVWRDDRNGQRRDRLLLQ